MCVVVMCLIIALGLTEFVVEFSCEKRKTFRPASDDNPPRGPRGIGRAAIENETSRSRL